LWSGPLDWLGIEALKKQKARLDGTRRAFV
jgi:hypothetical protein